MHKVQHDKRVQLQPSPQDSRWETAPVTPAMNNSSREDIVISPLMLCLPPTLVGGQRPKSLFREPASAGLLEEFKSPAQAGSRAICRPSNHQLKRVANRNICLCVSRFMRNLVNRWAIFTRPAGATTNEPRTPRHGGGRNDTRINTQRPMTRHAPDASENDRADLRRALDHWRAKESVWNTRPMISRTTNFRRK